MNIAHINGITLCFIFVKLKRSDDILEGINKLDDILKISCF